MLEITKKTNAAREVFRADGTGNPVVVQQLALSQCPLRTATMQIVGRESMIGRRAARQFLHLLGEQRQRFRSDLDGRRRKSLHSPAGRHD